MGLAGYALVALVGLDLAYVGLLAFAFVRRLTFPFELEWFEGVAIDNVHRIIHGLPTYGPPDASFAPSHYPPLFYLVALPLLQVTGSSLAGARLVSWLALLGASVASVLAVRRAGCSWSAVAFMLGTEAAFYPLTRFWYDLARVDSLTTGLVIAGVTTLAADGARPVPRRIAAGALLLAAAVFAKQTALLVALAPIVAFALRRDWTRTVAYGVAFGMFALVGAAALWWWTDGGIVEIYTIPRYHYVGPEGLEPFGWLVLAMTPYLLIAVAGAFTRVGPPVTTLRFVLLHALAALVVATISSAKVGGETNSAMPAIFLVAIAAAVGGEQLWRTAERAGRERAAATGAIVFVVVLVAIARPTDLLNAIPTSEDRQEADAIWQDMRSVQGDFLAYDTAFESTILHGKTHALDDRLYDWAGGFDAATLGHPDLARYPEDYLAAIRERRYPAVYTTAAHLMNDPVHELIEKHYVPVRMFGREPSTRSTTPRWRWCLPRVKWAPRP